MWAAWTIATATLALCGVLAVPLLDLDEIAVNDADTPTNVYDPDDETMEITIGDVIINPIAVNDADTPTNVYDPDDETMEITIGDVIINPHRNALANPDMKWPGGIIPYTLSAFYSADIRSTIMAAMREIEQDVNNATHVCVRFTPRAAQSNYIRIYPGTGCRAPVGMLNSGRQDVSLGRGCETKGIIMHELIHVLGFWHEHNRPDRDTYININLTNVLDNTQLDFRKVPATMLNTLDTPYDLGSIMHYNPYTEAIDKAIPVITPKPGHGDGIKLGQRLALSNWDVVRIQRWYGCTEDSLTRCDFASDMCTLTQDNTNEFLWTVQQGSSGAGPQEGNTNGVEQPNRDEGTEVEEVSSSSDLPTGVSDHASPQPMILNTMYQLMC